VKVDGALVDAYYFCVGGALGLHQAVARPIGLRMPATEVAPAIERLLRAYLLDRFPGENFRRFAARQSEDELRALLAGTLVESVARDASPGSAPHGVDG
jgi:sulfite reductase (ferredoxin)